MAEEDGEEHNHTKHFSLDLVSHNMGTWDENDYPVMTE